MSHGPLKPGADSTQWTLLANLRLCGYWQAHPVPWQSPLSRVPTTQDTKGTILVPRAGTHQISANIGAPLWVQLIGESICKNTPVNSGVRSCFRRSGGGKGQEVRLSRKKWGREGIRRFGFKFKKNCIHSNLRRLGQCCSKQVWSYRLSSNLVVSTLPSSIVSVSTLNPSLDEKLT